MGYNAYWPKLLQCLSTTLTLGQLNSSYIVMTTYKHRNHPKSSSAKKKTWRKYFRMREMLKLLTCADSSTNKKNVPNIYKGKKGLDTFLKDSVWSCDGVGDISWHPWQGRHCQGWQQISHSHSNQVFHLLLQHETLYILWTNKSYLDQTYLMELENISFFSIIFWLRSCKPKASLIPPVKSLVYIMQSCL